MPSTKETSQEEINKILITSFIKDVFNNHNLLYIENVSIEGRSSRRKRR
jgi:hypothetical protein